MKTQISYYLMDPTKNMTILVETPVPEASFPFVAQKLMELVPEAEQVGFVRGGSDAFVGKCTAKDMDATVVGHESCRNEEAKLPTLRMAGGEFCGNASMSAAVYYAIQEEYERAGVAAENDACDNGMIGTAGGFEDNKEKTIMLRVSGAADPVEVQVRRSDDRLNIAGCSLDGDREASVGLNTGGPDEIWHGRVHMPKPLSIGDERFPDGSILPVVRFEGIAHVIIDRADASEPSVSIDESDAQTMVVNVSGNEPGESMNEPEVSADALKCDDDQAEKLAASWCEHLQADAIGLMFLNETHDEMHPLVYVPAAGTCVWESSCASGTTAAGAYLAWKDSVYIDENAEILTGTRIANASVEPSGKTLAAEKVRYRLQQPGGVLEIEVTPEGEYYLMGHVTVHERQEVMVDVAER